MDYRTFYRISIKTSCCCGCKKTLKSWWILFILLRFETDRWKQTPSNVYTQTHARTHTGRQHTWATQSSPPFPPSLDDGRRAWSDVWYDINHVFRFMTPTIPKRRATFVIPASRIPTCCFISRCIAHGTAFFCCAWDAGWPPFRTLSPLWQCKQTTSSRWSV